MFSVPSPPLIACIALGSNLGDRAASIAAALHAMGSLPQTSLLRASNPVETDPVSPIPQPPYLNAAAVIRTALPARELLGGLLEIERRLGRTRVPGERWGPRTIDLDLLLYGNHVIDEPGLTIPHPRMGRRLFVLIPLADIAPDLIVPGLGLSVAALRDSLLAAGTQAERGGSH